MNFDKIKLIKSGKHISIFNNKMEKIYFTELLLSKFGNEYNDNVNYINWSVSDDLCKTLQKLEEDFCEYIRKQFVISLDWQWKSSIRQDQFLRTTNSSNMKIEKNISYTIKITLNSVWINKQTKTFGILWTC